METGVNQLGFISSYSPIGDDEHGHYVARPEYYGMLAFAYGAPGDFVESHLSAGSSNLAAYATLKRDDRLLITLINKESGVDAKVSVSGVEAFKRGSVVRLSAASLESSTEVSFGGVAVKPHGTWKAEREEKIQSSDGRWVVNLPAASAAILTLVR